MSKLQKENFDDTGKCNLDNIYNCTDPRAYFSELRKLDYLIPQNAKPTFLKILEAYKETKGVEAAKLVDLGCSYGVNAALLKYDLDMKELYNLYGTEAVGDMNRQELIERDRQIFSEDETNNQIEVVGVDVAQKAATYAEEADIIDDKIVADLEMESLSPKQFDLLDNVDLVISTGCIGYISEKTIGRVLEASHSHKPWMAHYVLRMFSFEPIKQVLAEMGYVTTKGTKPVPQRKFVSKEEKAQIIQRLVKQGIDPSGFETEGWLYADLYISRPVSDTSYVSSAELVTM